MVVELTAVLLNQLLCGRKSVLDAYGEIVYKAWRDATGACLERIENHLIQDVSVYVSCVRFFPQHLIASDQEPPLQRHGNVLHSQEWC